MRVTVNQESVEVEESRPTIRTLLASKEMPDQSVVVAVNGDVVRREEWDSHRIEEGDEVEIVHAVAGGSGADELVIAGERFSSRLFLERVMNLGKNRIEMRISRSAWLLRDLRFPHS